jgi:hypothetical protein
MMYFGTPWDVPALDGATPVDTPIGQPCLQCSEPIAAGDRGWLMPVLCESDPTANPTHAEFEPIHAECQLLSVIGHLYGVCRCTGWDTSTRAAAREVWTRMKMRTPRETIR